MADQHMVESTLAEVVARIYCDRNPVSDEAWIVASAEGARQAMEVIHEDADLRKFLSVEAAGRATEIFHNDATLRKFLRLKHATLVRDRLVGLR